jgi:hypothetical protein
VHWLYTVSNITLNKWSTCQTALEHPHSRRSTSPVRQISDADVSACSMTEALLLSWILASEIKKRRKRYVGSVDTPRHARSRKQGAVRALRRQPTTVQDTLLLSWTLLIFVHLLQKPRHVWRGTCIWRILWEWMEWKGQDQSAELLDVLMCDVPALGVQISVQFESLPMMHGGLHI